MLETWNIDFEMSEMDSKGSTVCHIIVVILVEVCRNLAISLRDIC